MKNIILAAFLLLLAEPAHAQLQPPYQWQEHTIIGFNADNSKRPIGIFVTTVYPVGDCLLGAWNYSPCNSPPNTWIDEDIGQFNILNPTTVAEIFLSGEFIITPSNGAIGTPEVDFMCRAPGSQLPAQSWNGYNIGQDEPSGVASVGVRSVEALWCPVVNGEFEWMWSYSNTMGSIPSGEYFGINLSLQAYVR